MMCKHVESVLVAYLDGEVTPAERAAIEAHLAGCRTCADELAAMQAVRHQVGVTLQAMAATVAPSPQAWAHLQGRLTPQPKTSWTQQLVGRLFSTQPGWWGALAGALALAILLAGTIAVYPPTRAWAQDALSNLLSYFGFSREAPVLPVVTVRRVDPDEVTPQTANPPLVLLTREQAQAQVDFPVKAPTYLPVGYTPGRLGAEGGAFEVGTEVKGVFWAATKKTHDLRSTLCSSFYRDISLSQVPASEPTMFPRRIGNAKAIPVTVGGSPGLWIEKVVVGGGTGYNPDGSVMCTYQYLGNILTWEQDGIRYGLMADSTLGLDEMLRIAGSLE